VLDLYNTGSDMQTRQNGECSRCMKALSATPTRTWRALPAAGRRTWWSSAAKLRRAHVSGVRMTGIACSLKTR
jgi:hypothetical protein